MDARLELLKGWLRDLGYEDYEIAPASADASFRRYFRVRHGGRSFIVMDAPPQREDTAPFIKVAGILAQAGLHVPEIEARDTQQGFLQLSDLGDRTYLAALDETSVEAYYADAMQALLRLQAAPVTVDLPPYDHTLLMTEMGLFRDWYLARHLGLMLSDEQQTLLQETFDWLAQAALEQPRVIVHRDYHSRNLMVCQPNTGPNPGSNPGVLDFQDAVIGPVTYDLVSLLRDCYIAWPRQRVEQWVAGYHRQAQQQGLLAGVDAAQFLRWFDLMGIQRQLKASGIFARLYHRDGKPGYLPDIPRTLNYILEVAPDYAPLAAFVDLLRGLPRPDSGRQAGEASA